MCALLTEGSKPSLAGGCYESCTHGHDEEFFITSLCMLCCSADAESEAEGALIKSRFSTGGGAGLDSGTAGRGEGRAGPAGGFGAALAVRDTAAFSLLFPEAPPYAICLFLILLLQNRSFHGALISSALLGQYSCHWSPKAPREVVISAVVQEQVGDRLWESGQERDGPKDSLCPILWSGAMCFSFTRGCPAVPALPTGPAAELATGGCLSSHLLVFPIVPI